MPYRRPDTLLACGRPASEWRAFVRARTNLEPADVAKVNRRMYNKLYWEFSRPREAQPMKAETRMAITPALLPAAAAAFEEFADRAGPTATTGLMAEWVLGMVEAAAREGLKPVFRRRVA